LENRYKFNEGSELESKEFSDGTGLDLYATEFRSYDPQIGRFHQIDPLGEATDDWSPFAFAFNNPVIFNDALGLTPDSVGKPAPGFINTPATAPVLDEVVVVSPPKNNTSNTPAVSVTLAGAAPIFPYPSWQIVPKPVSGPGKVVNFNPKPVPSPIGALPIVLRGVGTIVGAVMPTVGGLASGVPYHYPNPFAPGPFGGHGNSDDNTNPHIVYTFTFTPKDNRTPVIKYGISDVYAQGMNRPNSQLANYQARFGASVRLMIMGRTLNRFQAKFIERSLVTKHVSDWGEMPRDQRSPKLF